MSNRLGDGRVRSLGALALAGSASAAPPAEGAADRPAVKPSTPRALRLPETPYRYADIELPAHFRSAAARHFDNTPRDNPVTDAGATLVRVLFYDSRLLGNNTVACGSCHLQSHAFAAPQRATRRGKRLLRCARLQGKNVPRRGGILPPGTICTGGYILSGFIIQPKCPQPFRGM
jgi:hypothetical protein